MTRDDDEEREQIALATWLDATGLLWCHVPNGGRRDRRTACRLKAAGVKPGVPDVLVFTRAAPHVGMAVELKRPRVKGRPRGRTSPEQAEWLRMLRGLGWRAVVCEGYAEAVDAILAQYPHVAGRLRGPALAPRDVDDDSAPF